MSLSHLVFGAGCGIRLYRFLIIAFLSAQYTFVNTSSSTVEDDGLEGVNSYHVALGIVLLICLIAALALCGGNTVAAGTYFNN